MGYRADLRFSFSWLCRLSLFCAALPALGAQQPGAHTVHSIFLAPDRSASGASLERRIAQELKAASIHVTGDQGDADGVLQVKTVTWPQGTIAVSPRGRTLSAASYQGYASAELRNREGQVLWSYLVTPRKFHVAGIESDLADQLSRNLLAALRGGLSSGLGIGAVSSRGNTVATSLHIAGATFPAPLYVKWFQTFGQQQGGTSVSYDAIGSAKGMSELAAGKIDVAASDIPPQPGDSSQDLVRIPTVVGGVVPIYNLPGTSQELRLTGDILADIYAGKIQKWNDERIRRWNKAVRLPDAAIVVVHRSDGSGTTFVWTSFLAAASAEWKSRIGDTIEWPAGQGYEGNQGVADQVAKTPNSLGYVELTYAIQHQLQYAAVRNPAGSFIRADIASLTAAVEGKTGQAGNALNATGPDAYPIATFTWFVVPGQATRADAQKREATVALLQWVLTEGQKECSSLAYVPLPRELASRELQEIKALH
jgi:phosphate transport system substrate-binding protein